MKGSKNTRCIISVSAAVSALVQAQAAIAQEEASLPVLTEITVTATRRKETVTDVPYNISALTGQDLERSGIEGLASLSQGIAGLEYVDQGPRASGNNNQLILRGLNADGTNGIDNAHFAVAPVSTYLGETPLFFNLKLFDMDRVEVLRGPQGTLYGSGSLGGTVRFIPNNPQFGKFSGQARAELSSTTESGQLNHDLYAMVNIPVGDNLAVRLAGGKQHLGGFIDEKNLAVAGPDGAPQITGPILDPATSLVRATLRNTNTSDVSYARAALGMSLGDNVLATLHYNYQHTDVGDRQADNPLYPGNTSYDASTALLNPQTSKTEVVGLDVEVDLGFATLSSATSWYETQERALESDGGIYQLVLADAFYFGYPRFVVPGYTETREHAAMQEFRLTSKGDNTFDWLVGGYYQKQHRNYSLRDASDPGLADYVAALDPFEGYFGTPTPGIAGLDLFDQTFMEAFRDTALFGELTWHVTNRWQLTGGARKFWQRDSSSQSFALPVCQQLTFCGPPESVADTNSVNSQIFRANTSFKLDKLDNLYFTWSQGFRHGGANALPPDGTPQSDPRAPFTFRPDRSTNYEVGLKGTIPNAPFRYSLAAFYIRWRDFQFDSFTSTGFTFVGNGNQASSRGVELELNGDLGEHWSYSASYSYVDAKLDKPFSVVTTGNAGDSMPGVPSNSASVGLNYLQPLPADYKLTVHLDGSYRDSAHSDFNASAADFFPVKSFSVWNAAAILAASSRWEVRLFADNLFSEKGRTGGSPPQQLGNEAFFQVMRPLTVGARLTVNF
jgi:outer membrane receptor protein involved in Fe transport